MSRLGDACVGLIFCLSTACGRAKDDKTGLHAKAGASGDAPDATPPGQYWLALINEQVELVRFDDDSPPTSISLADSELAATVAFTGDGKRLAFAVRTGAWTEQGAWDVQVVSAPDGERCRVPGVCPA